MNRKEVRAYVKQYDILRDMQFAAYELYARKHGLSAKELFVLALIWFAPDGCLQSEICERLSTSKQTISAIVKKFWTQGYLSMSEAKTDRRNKTICLTEQGKAYAQNIIPPAVNAEIDAMTELSEEDIAALVRITTQFSRGMERKFAKLREELTK